MTLLAGPAPVTTRGRRLLAPALTIGGLGLAALALRLRDPHVAGSWGVCPSLSLFGVYCPGCGGLRAVNDLSHGDLVGAASSNLLLVVLAPVAVLLLARWTWSAWSGEPVRTAALPRTVSWSLAVLAIAVLVAFTVLRNVPAGSWLAP